MRLARSAASRLLLQGRNPFGRLRFRQGIIHGFARFVTERLEVRALRGGHGLIPRRPLVGIFPYVPSCQFLAQNTHPHTSPEKGRKALLERRRQGM